MTASARQRDLVATAVEALPPQHRQVLVTAWYEGRSAVDTAQALGLPVQVVKQRIYEALQQIRRTVAVDGRPAPSGPGRNPVAA